MPCLPGYRYCGPGCSGPGAPLNQLDAYCMQHDVCYRQPISRRICDEIFLQRLYPYTFRNDKLGRDASLMYRAISFKNRL